MSEEIQAIRPSPQPPILIPQQLKARKTHMQSKPTHPSSSPTTHLTPSSAPNPRLPRLSMCGIRLTDCEIDYLPLLCFAVAQHFSASFYRFLSYVGKGPTSLLEIPRYDKMHTCGKMPFRVLGIHSVSHIYIHQNIVKEQRVFRLIEG